jgi:hypothetical protein
VTQTFRDTEILAAVSLLAYIPEDKSEAFHQNFQEFKGWQLFRGYGPFEGISEAVRFQIISLMLHLVRSFSFPVIFGALNKAEWEREKSKSGSLFVYGGASRDDICFRGCLKGMGDYIQQNQPSTFALAIADDYKDKDTKDRLRSAFYGYRERLQPRVPPTSPPFLHDDMYFGDSRYSIGIQLADLCGYFIAKHLAEDPDPNVDRFYKIIEGQVMYSLIEPGNRLVHPVPMIDTKTGKDIRDVRVQKIRPDNAKTDPSSAQRDQSRSGRGESS